MISGVINEFDEWDQWNILYSMRHSNVTHLLKAACVVISEEEWEILLKCGVFYTAWLKKIDSISYVYLSWTIYGMWMIYIIFERGGPTFSNTTTRALA